MTAFWNPNFDPYQELVEHKELLTNHSISINTLAQAANDHLAAIERLTAANHQLHAELFRLRHEIKTLKAGNAN